MEPCWDFMWFSLKAWKSWDVLAHTLSCPDFNGFVAHVCSRWSWEVKLTSWLLDVHVELNLCPDNITLTLDWRKKDVARTDFHIVKVSSLLQRSVNEPPSGGSAVPTRSLCYLLHPVRYFLSLLPCHPGGCSILQADWAENPLQLISTRNSPACHPFPLQSCRRSCYLFPYLPKGL